MDTLFIGLGFILIASLSNGAFGLPLRLRRRYEMENTMLIGYGISAIVAPMTIVYLVFPEWAGAISGAGAATVAAVMAFGVGWGIGCITFGIGITSLGLSLGFAVIMGIVTAVGSVIPMLRRWDQIPPDAKGIILAGIAVCVLGVIIVGKAGGMREQQTGSASGAKSAAKDRGGFLVGLIICILSGVFSACANLGFDFGEPIGREATRMGLTSPIWATLPRWLPIYWSGYAVLFIYMLATMAKNKTFDRYTGPGSARDFGLASLMGVLQAVVMPAYGMATVYIGANLGTSVGFAVFIATSIIVANLLGFVTGEWRKAPRPAVNMLYLGLAVLIAAIVILASGNTLVPA